MEINKPTVFQYHDLINNLDWNAWNRIESFPIEKLSRKPRSELLTLSGFEVTFIGIQGNRDKFDSVIQQFDDYVIQFILDKLPNSYLFVSEHIAGRKNRVRSHKGVLPKKILNPKDFIEEEVSLEDGETIICGVIRLHIDNIKTCLELFSDNSRSFIITGSEHLLSSVFLNKIISQCFVHKNGYYLDYASLFLNYCINGNCIFRMGGDGGDQEISFQGFCLSSQIRNYCPS